MKSKYAAILLVSATMAIGLAGATAVYADPQAMEQPTGQFGNNIQGISGREDNSNSMLFNQQFGTRRRLAVMAARLKADIECAVLKGADAFFLRPPQAIDLRVRSSEDLVPPLGQHFLDALTGTYQDGTHHRIRCHIISPQTG